MCMDSDHCGWFEDTGQYLTKMVACDELGEGLVCKPTGLLTNREEVLWHMERRCSGDHRHVQLVSGRAKKAGEYTEAFCRAIVEVSRYLWPSQGMRRK